MRRQAESAILQCSEDFNAMAIFLLNAFTNSTYIYSVRHAHSRCVKSCRSLVSAPHQSVSIFQLPFYASFYRVYKASITLLSKSLLPSDEI